MMDRRVDMEICPSSSRIYFSTNVRDVQFTFALSSLKPFFKWKNYFNTLLGDWDDL